jgi:hypothetical protein
MNYKNGSLASQSEVAEVAGQGLEIYYDLKLQIGRSALIKALSTVSRLSMGGTESFWELWLL